VTGDDAVLTETIPSALDGERLDRVVAMLADVSRTASAALIGAGGVTLGGVAATVGKVRVRAGDVVAVDTALVPRAEAPAPDATVAFTVVYEDDDVIVVDKPAGLVVHPGAGNRDGTLVNGLLARFPGLLDIGDADRPGIVHRLDAGSSGLLVVARTDAALRSLQAQFADRSAGRRYDVLLWGHPSAPHGVIDAPIGRDPADPLKMAVVAGGRAARTEYEVIRRFASPAALALVSCRLETGRTHQIRVHLTAVGHPLVGDSVYGARRATLGLGRPFLHASELSFRHPRSGDDARFESPLPADLAAVLHGLEPDRAT
jgi:23S rRNA pseudouridine1911/1915/1917 synthase